MRLRDEELRRNSPADPRPLALFLLQSGPEATLTTKDVAEGREKPCLARELLSQRVQGWKGDPGPTAPYNLPRGERPGFSGSLEGP